MANLYYNPAGGNWSASNWGPSGGPYSSGPPGVGDTGYLNGAVVVCDVSTITCTAITNVTSGGYMTLDCSVATGRSYTLTCNLVGGTVAMIRTNSVTGATNLIYGVKITGNITGGTGTNSYALQLGTTASGSYYAPPTTVVGNVTGGSGTGSRGIYLYNVGFLSITGTVTGGSAAGSSAYGVGVNYGGSTIAVTGDVVGGSNGASNFGIYGNTTANVIVIGNIMGGSGSTDTNCAGICDWIALTQSGGNLTATNNGAALTYVSGGSGTGVVTGNLSATGVTGSGVVYQNGGVLTVNGNVTAGGDACWGLAGTYTSCFIVNGNVSGGAAGTNACGVCQFASLVITGNIINTANGAAYTNNTTIRPAGYGNVTWNPASSTNYIQFKKTGGTDQYTVQGIASYPTANQVQYGVVYQGGATTGTYTGGFSDSEKQQIRKALGLTGTSSSTSGTGLLDSIFSKQPAYQPNTNVSGEMELQDVTLTSDGLDNISTTAPSGVASNFREMLVQVWRLFFKKTARTSSTIKIYADNGTDVLTTQSITASGYDETQGAAS